MQAPVRQRHIVGGRRAALALLLACAAIPAAATETTVLQAVACPAEQHSQVDKAEYERAIAPYRGDVDPLPPGTKERPLPVPRFRRAADLDKDFPLSVRATAVLLQDEDGKVARVLVPCASSDKAIAPIVTAMAKAKLAKSTRDGKPAKAMVVVPVEWGL